MRKNGLGMLLVLGIGLTPLYEAAADGCIQEAGCVLEEGSVPATKQETGPAAETSSEAYAPEVSTGATAAVSTDTVTALVSSSAAAITSISTAVTAVSSETEKLADYFTVETSTLQEVGQTKLAEWQQKLQGHINELNKRVRGMAEDGVVTSGELADLKEALKSYGGLRYSANQKLAFYRLSIPEDELVKVYWKLALIQDGQFSVDDKKESIKRFFVNLTGQDVRVKMGVMDKLGLTFIGSIAILIPILAL